METPSRAPTRNVTRRRKAAATHAEPNTPRRHSQHPQIGHNDEKPSTSNERVPDAINYHHRANIQLVNRTDASLGRRGTSGPTNTAQLGYVTTVKQVQTRDVPNAEFHNSAEPKPNTHRMVHNKLRPAHLPFFPGPARIWLLFRAYYQCPRHACLPNICQHV